MAKITLEGYVNERKGKMLRVSEEYRVKDESGQWGNAGYGDFTVWLKDEDAQPEVQAGAIVLVSGQLKVKKTEKNGTTYTNLDVNFAKVGITRTTPKYAGQASSDEYQPSNSGWATRASGSNSGPSRGQQATPQWAQGDVESLPPF